MPKRRWQSILGIGFNKTAIVCIFLEGLYFLGRREQHLPRPQGMNHSGCRPYLPQRRVPTKRCQLCFPGQTHSILCTHLPFLTLFPLPSALCPGAFLVRPTLFLVHTCLSSRCSLCPVLSALVLCMADSLSLRCYLKLFIQDSLQSTLVVCLEGSSPNPLWHPSICCSFISPQTY